MVLNRHIDDRWIWTSARKVAFRMATDDRLAGALLMRLPSGRKIVYRNASIDEIINDADGASWVEPVIRYDGLDWTKKWTRIRSWGGKFVENMTQAVARDLLAGAVLQLDNDDDDLLTTIHDEIIAEPLAGARRRPSGRDEGGDGRSARLGLRSAPEGRGRSDGALWQIARSGTSIMSATTPRISSP